MDTSIGILSWRPLGGVAVLWRNKVSYKIDDDVRIIGCTLNKSISLLHLYLCHTYIYNIKIDKLYQCDDNYDDYMHYLGNVTSNIYESTTTNIRL